MLMAAYGAVHETLNASEASGLHLYLDEVRRLPQLEPTEEARLLARVGLGDTAAVDEVTVRNLRLVAEIIADDTAEDATIFARLERGNQALLEAIVSFAGSGRRSFRSYARSYIRRTIRGLMQ
jgi:DNA-directed RNA polymerase sigma subunit (sigma70/sigma32)